MYFTDWVQQDSTFHAMRLTVPTMLAAARENLVVPRVIVPLKLINSRYKTATSDDASPTVNAM